MKTGPWAGLGATNRRLQAKVDGIARQLRGMTIGVGIIGVGTIPPYGLGRRRC